MMIEMMQQREVMMMNAPSPDPAKEREFQP
jgi:hypothetical protein